MWITFDFGQNQKNNPQTLKIEGNFIHKHLKLYTACGQLTKLNNEKGLTQNNLVDNLV
jgi:hypothetical protein